MCLTDRGPAAAATIGTDWFQVNFTDGRWSSRTFTLGGQTSRTGQARPMTSHTKYYAPIYGSADGITSADAFVTGHAAQLDASSISPRQTVRAIKIQEQGLKSKRNGVDRELPNASLRCKSTRFCTRGASSEALFYGGAEEPRPWDGHHDTPERSELKGR